MPEYIVYPIESSPDEIAEEALTYLAENVEGYEPRPGQLEVITIEAVSFMIAELRDIASDVPPAIFRYLGKHLFNFPPIDATPATGDLTVSVVDTDGHTVPDQTVFGVRDAAGDLVPFETVGDVVIFPGLAVTADGEVPIVAQIEGEAASGLSGTPELIDDLDFYLDSVLVDPTSGGIDAESDDEYLTRLASYLELLTPRPILARDAAIFVRTLVPGVGRATALDNFDPADGSDDNERMVTVALVDEDGLDVSGAVKSAADALLQSEREQTFIFHVIDPTRTPVDVTVVGVAYEGYDTGLLEDDIVQAITDYFSPKNWGRPTIFGSLESDWYNEPNVYRLELSQVVNNVTGFHRVTTLTLALDGGALGTADLVLPGHIPLPEVGDINVTVNAP